VCFSHSLVAATETGLSSSHVMNLGDQDAKSVQGED